MRVVKITLVAAFLAVVGLAAPSADYVSQFELFKSIHKRQYVSSSEEAKRLGFFIRNMQKAEQMQALNAHARFGMNEFSDMSEAEFKVRHNAEGHFRTAVAKRAKRAQPAKLKAAGSQSADWRNQGAVTAVKNQGQCGSCWSFSTTGNIEGQWAIAGNSLVSLSEQELVSCDTLCSGCNGGLMDDAFDWLVETQGGGITLEADYPYVSGGGYVPPCQGGQSPAAYISGHQDVAHDEGSMAAFVAQSGPLSIAVDATSWQSYGGGVMTDCQATQVDHGVLIVGFDTSASPPFWIIKNSWGPGWGESGYIRIMYGANECLITTVPSSSTAGQGLKLKEPPVKQHHH